MEKFIIIIIILVPIVVCQYFFGFWLGLLIGIAILFAIAILFGFSMDRNSKRHEDEIDAIWAEADKKYEDKRKQLVSQYGEVKKMFKDEYGRRDLLIIFENPTYVYINDEIFETKSILGCEIKDLHWKPQEEYTTKQSVTDVVGRSVVGGLIGGVPGAIIGGTTAKRTTKVNQNSECNYVVTVLFNDYNHPKEMIAFGNDLKRAEEFATLIRLIVTNNNPEKQ